MTRKVNFSSLSDGAKLPNINKGQNWVNDRQRRFHSEPRRAAGKPTVQGHGNAFAFPTPQNSHLVSRDNPNGNHGNGSYSNYDPPRDGRRLRSLPPTKPKRDEFDSRQIRSAPNNEEKNGQNAGQHGTNMAESRLRPQPRSRISDNDTGRELPQRFHGKATRAYEERYLRSNKFASSWAQVRADNPAFNDLSPDGSPVAARKYHPKDNQSPTYSNKLNSPRDSSPGNQEELKREHKKSVAKQNRGRPHHKTRTKTRLKFADENNNGGSPGTASNDEDCEALNDDKGSPNSEQRERKVSRKKEWVDSVVMLPYDKPPPKHASLRYLDNLTFKPNINTGKDVFKTYVEKKPVRQKTADPNKSFSENEEGYDSPTNYSTYSQDESEDDHSQERPKKEAFLNRREAIKYIKMNNVYGSDAYKNQRKEWFVQKYAEVTDTKAKFEAEQKREEKRKRQEDMKKQQRQLNHVRQKFRKEQEHRFRTQYVTARVLEYEQVNRHVYGLPEDYLDLANELNRNSDDENDTTTEPDSKNQGNESQTKEKAVKPPPSKPNNKNSPVKKGEKKTNTSPTRGDVKKKKEEEGAMAALAKARENQRNWYAQSNSGLASPTADNRSHASHSTSGYESEKHPSVNADNAVSHTETDKIKHGNENRNNSNDNNNKNSNNASKSSSHDKNKDSQTAHKRLESQKNIYAKPQVRQQVPKQKANMNNSMQNKNNPDISDKTKPSGTLNNNHESNTTSGEQDSVNNDDVTKSQRLKESEIQKSAQTATKTGSKSDKPTVDTSSHLNSQKEKQNDPNSKSSIITPSTKDDSNKSSATQGNSKATNRGPNTTFGEASKNCPSSTQDVPGLSSGNNTNSKQEAVKDPSNNNPNITQNTTIDNKQGAKSTPNTGHTIPKGQSKVNEAHGKDTPQVKDNGSNVDQAKTNQKGNNKETTNASTLNVPQNTDNQQSSSKQPPSSVQHSAPKAQQPSSSPAHKPIPPSNNVPKIVSHDELEEFPHQLVHPVVVSNKTPGPRKDSMASSRPPQHPQSPPKKVESSASRKNTPGESRRRMSRAESGKTQPKKKESVADRMFNIKAGPTWDPKRKTPKMEGIDTVVVNTKDKKGLDVKKRKDVKDVVKEADNLLKVNTDTGRGSSRQKHNRAASPDLTLGSDFEVDDDDELADDDIFERLRRKYNIAIDSDEEDDQRV